MNELKILIGSKEIRKWKKTEKSLKMPGNNHLIICPYFVSLAIAKTYKNLYLSMSYLCHTYLGHHRYCYTFTHG
ncbi:hypothetical protein FBQ80_16905 [Candidatus Brocadia sp. AMX2]|uniref:hypothetical protein n=1 Tax=Candidatus Brocadia TaxID=380240 RepID=UPI0012FF1A27|nr:MULTISPECIES: hypothetical protein [Brocadia]MCK6468660.1 hypothetical protein [Candidatus Brocadia sinica]MDL1937208.1 hypothetical protein [Candidatus Brocadia sp. AMX2]NOG42457.1 hypothetical protein [Planctomycetota bacterium]NUO04546.1 hypothetical protein [Candidatus Brocadia sinica]